MRSSFSFVTLLGAVLVLTACHDDVATTPVTVTVKPVGTIAVDGTMDSAQMLAAGQFDNIGDPLYINQLLNARNKNKRDEEMALVSFSSDAVSSEDAEAGIRARGYHPADLDECLAYSAALVKGWQTYDLDPPTYKTVCLGQFVQVNYSRYFPMLVLGDNYDYERGWDLELGRGDRDVSSFFSWGSKWAWSQRTRFLAVHN
jgi:hypothetical protein